MTLAEYMSPGRFPLTTQKGLTPHQQMMLDAINYDDLAAYEDEGRPMTAEQQPLWAELKEKHAARPAVVAELKAGGEPT